MLLVLWLPDNQATDRPGTLTVPNVSFFLPANSTIQNEFGSTWTSVGLRSKPDWKRRDVVYSPDIRVIAAPAVPADGNRLVLLPALWRATLSIGKQDGFVKVAIFAEAGLLGAFTSKSKSRFTAAPTTGLGFSVSRNRLDIEAQYLQPLNMDGRDFTGYAIGFGYRL